MSSFCWKELPLNKETDFALMRLKLPGSGLSADTLKSKGDVGHYFS
jgi:hypothetical protein